MTAGKSLVLSELSRLGIVDKGLKDRAGSFNVMLLKYGEDESYGIDSTWFALSHSTHPSPCPGLREVLSNVSGNITTHPLMIAHKSLAYKL